MSEFSGQRLALRALVRKTLLERYGSTPVKVIVAGDVHGRFGVQVTNGRVGMNVCKYVPGPGIGSDGRQVICSDREIEILSIFLKV